VLHDVLGKPLTPNVTPAAAIDMRRTELLGIATQSPAGPLAFLLLEAVRLFPIVPAAIQEKIEEPPSGSGSKSE
jgi:hypothetical protein